MPDKTFTIQATMNERWVNDFCSMLKWMERCGNIGHSSLTGFFADGDGDFRPKFEIDTEFKEKRGYFPKENLDGNKRTEAEVIFDAG